MLYECVNYVIHSVLQWDELDADFLYVHIKELM